MANKKIPSRQCVGCHASKAKSELIRVIKTPENEVVLDATGRKNGRGAYVCPSMDCLRKAIKNNGLSRSLGVAIPDDVYADLEKEMSALAK